MCRIGQSVRPESARECGAAQSDERAESPDEGGPAACKELAPIGECFGRANAAATVFPSLETGIRGRGELARRLAGVPTGHGLTRQPLRHWKDRVAVV